jgi:predicted RNA binding protein YcfA (HicA-like mRNA interferase family)
MPRMPRVTGAEVAVALRRAGWQPVAGAKGGHRQFKHPQRPGRVTVPVHAGEILPLPTLNGILKQAGMTVDELRDLL